MSVLKKDLARVLRKICLYSTILVFSNATESNGMFSALQTQIIGSRSKAYV